MNRLEPQDQWTLELEYIAHTMHFVIVAFFCINLDA